MIVLIKLILAHLVGDFLLQPSGWVKEKEEKKLRSPKLFVHIFIHGALVLLLLRDFDYGVLALWLMALHGMIDILKLYAQNQETKTHWFLMDQGLHIFSIIILWILFCVPRRDLESWQVDQSVWVYSTALLFVTVVSGVVMSLLMSSWSKSLDDSHEESLSHAGRYIGMLERIFVFTFVVTSNWEGIGFLLAAKSVFRFGDLKESKDRKLTEYILIGTLLSFGIAIATGMVTLKLVEIL